MNGLWTARTRLTILLAALLLTVAALAMLVIDLQFGASGSDALGSGATPIVVVSGSGLMGFEMFVDSALSDGASPTAPADPTPFLIAAWIGLVPVCLVVASWLARRFTGGLDAVTRAASAAGPANLTPRVALAGGTDDERRLGVAFNGLMDRFERHELDRRRLVDDAAHEVRNPLAVMQTTLEVALADQADPAALRNAAEVSQRAAERISRTIETLNADLRDSHPETARAPIDLGEVARELGRDYAATAAQHGLSVQVAAGTGLIVQADRDAIKRALANLLANGVRFAPAGSPLVIGAGSAPGWCWLGVRDFGPGIAADEQPLVFRRGWRGPAVDGEPGSGIGLALVRQIAEAHGGTVRLNAAPRAGSAFVIWLPAADGVAPTGAVAAARTDTSAARSAPQPA